jgi:hypothetical protein
MVFVAAAEPAPAAFWDQNDKIAFSSNRGQYEEEEGVDNPTGDHELFSINRETIDNVGNLGHHFHYDR